MSFSNLEIKSKENRKAAEICENSNLISSSISRYYYSILQLIIFLLEKYNKYEQPKKGEDSHEILMQSMAKLLLDKNIGNIFAFKGDFQIIKKYRKTADYLNEILIKSDVENVKKCCDKMLVYLNKLQ